MGRNKNRQRRDSSSNHRLPLTSFVPYDSISVINYQTGELRPLYATPTKKDPWSSPRPVQRFQQRVSTMTTKNSNLHRSNDRYKSLLPSSGDLFNTPHHQKKLPSEHPLGNLICVSRKIRKEVLHALGKTGRGGGKQRRPKFSLTSSVRCK